MAEKRTTPGTPPDAQQDAAASARRKKRAAPTIDLTATELPPAPQGEPSPQAGQPSPAPEPPQAGSEPTSSETGIRLGDHINVGAYIAGATGAVAMTLILLALWLTGLVPVRHVTVNDAQTSVDTKAIDALTRRVGMIEEAITKLRAGDTGVAERLAAADNAMKALGIALTALDRRTDDITANASQARERADAAEKAVTELRASVQDVAKNSSTGISSADLEGLQKRIASLEQSTITAHDDLAKTVTADTAARLALSAAALRDAALSGAPFADELAQVKSFGADDKAMAPLVPFAAMGIPTAQTLAQELRVLLPVMLKISGAQASDGSFLERLQANAGKLVRIRPVDAPPGNDPSMVLARIEIDAVKSDIPAALTDFSKLDDATRAPAQAWIIKANARQAALAAARQYAADAARAIGPKAESKAGVR